MISITISYNKNIPDEVKQAHDAVMKLTGFDKVKLQTNSTILDNSNYTETWEVDLKKDVSFHKEWAEGIWLVRDKIVKYNNMNYRVIQSHQSQISWTPDTTLSLFRPVPLVYPGETYPRWNSIGLMDSENNWDAGERVTWNGQEWESDIDNNVFEPGVSSWTNLSQQASVSEWVQPTGAHDTYSLGDTVLHNGSTWESIVDNNSWEPGVYGWQQI